MCEPLAALLLVASDARLRLALERAGYLVVAASSGANAEALVRSLAFDAVVMRRDGHAAERLAAVAGSIPIVAIGSDGESAAIVRAVTRRLSAPS